MDERVGEELDDAHGGGAGDLGHHALPQQPPHAVHAHKVPQQGRGRHVSGVGRRGHSQRPHHVHGVHDGGGGHAAGRDGRERRERPRRRRHLRPLHQRHRDCGGDAPFFFGSRWCALSDAASDAECSSQSNCLKHVSSLSLRAVTHTVLTEPLHTVLTAHTSHVTHSLTSHYNVHYRSCGGPGHPRTHATHASIARMPTYSHRPRQRGGLRCSIACASPREAASSRAPATALRRT